MIEQTGPQSLADWLQLQESVHFTEVDLGLARIGAVAQRLQLNAFDFPIISVAGTNGKGSSVAMLDSCYRAAGYQTATYTSPHLVDYNERIALNGEPVDDQSIIAAFEAIEDKREGTTLTYFEYATLAALLVFKARAPDVAILEVGLGGRLDAVNLVDATVSLVSAIGLDHTEYLGPDRESIGREKAGIFRRGRPAICSDPEVPQSIIDCAAKIGAELALIGVDFNFEPLSAAWHWFSTDTILEHLPYPGLDGSHQLRNASGVLAVLDALRDRLPISAEDIARGLAATTLSGRLQRETHFGVEHLFDVAHNVQAVTECKGFLERWQHKGKTHCVIAMLSDKPHAQVVELLAPLIDRWHIGSLGGPRGLSAEDLAARVHASHKRALIDTYEDVLSAHRGALELAQEHDRVVVIGSFQTVGAVLATLGSRDDEMSRGTG